MNRNQEFDNMKNEYLNIPIPESGKELVMNSISVAKLDKRKKQVMKIVTRICVSAAMICVLIAPNINSKIAYAMKNVPVIGGFFQLITIREYEELNENGNAYVSEARLQTDDVANAEVVSSINNDMDKYEDMILDEFRKKTESGSKYSLYIMDEVVTNTEEWFSVCVEVTEISADQTTINHYYTINKGTSKLVKLEDLFSKNVDYLSLISREIIRQMKEQKGVPYVVGTDEADSFKSISKDQKFYINTEGEVVIVFDEGEVAPAYIGEVQFVIPKSVYAMK